MPAFGPSVEPSSDTFSSFETADNPRSITRFVHSRLSGWWIDGDNNDGRFAGFNAALVDTPEGLMLVIRARWLEKDHGRETPSQEEVSFGSLAFIPMQAGLQRIVPILAGDTDHRPLAFILHLLRERYAPAIPVEQTDSSVEAVRTTPVAHTNTENKPIDLPSSRREVEFASMAPNATPVEVPDPVMPPQPKPTRKSGPRQNDYVRQRETWLYISPLLVKKKYDLPDLLTMIKNHRGELTCSLKTLGKIRTMGQRGLLDLDPRDFPT